MLYTCVSSSHVNTIVIACRLKPHPPHKSSFKTSHTCTCTVAIHSPYKKLSDSFFDLTKKPGSIPFLFLKNHEIHACV